jgi:N-acetylmuramoyl-L-alanine amidase
MNSFPEEKYRGLQVFYSPNNPASESLAVQIQNTTHEYLQQQNDRKIKKATSSIYLLDRLQCPAVLVECGFLSNPEEAALLAQSDYRRELAFVLFSAVMSYISSQNA